MEEGGEQDKSEQPTPFKLDRARRKGTVARGADLGFLTSLAAFLAYGWIAGPAISHQLTTAMRSALIATGSLADGYDSLLQVIVLLLAGVAAPVAVMAGVVFLVVLVFELLQSGFVFSAEPLRPDFSKLNPARGLKRLFSLRLLIETGKQILKLCAYTGIGYLAIREALQSDIGSMTDARAVAAALSHMAFRLLGAFVVLALIFAALDQLIVRRDFLKRMRMSRREVRREHKEREGDPRIKQKRKQLHAQFAKASQSLRNVRGADVLITNPTHLAIALKYDRATMVAPMVVSYGAGEFAQRLKRLAFLYGVPIVEDRALARELYRFAKLNAPIRESAFQPVATIYNGIRKKTGLAGA